MHAALRRLLLPLLCAALAPRAFAAGATAHVVAGELAISQLDDPYLRDVLKRHHDAFLSGTAVPDQFLFIQQGGEKIDSQLSSGSHGTAQEFCEAPKGYEAQIWSSYQACVKEHGKTDAKCERQLALLFGILTHEITDAPWHHDFIDKSSAGMCSACATDATPNGNGSYVSCNPGGKSVNRNHDDRDVTGGLAGRHLVADQDFDACLALRLNGHGDALDLKNMTTSLPATYKGKAQLPVQGEKAIFVRKIGCSGGEFPDAGFHDCYSCPSGYDHNPILTVDTKGVCTKAGEHWYDKRSNRTADKQHGYGGCDGGQFPDALGKGCYRCDPGYDHNPAFTVDTSGVCFKHASGGSVASNGGFCPAGQTPDPRNGGECWQCPDGYTRNILHAVDAPDACTAAGMVQCSGVTVPPGVKGVLPKLPADLYAVLDAALRGANVKKLYFNQVTIAAMVESFQALTLAERTKEVAPTLFTAAAAVCPVMIQHGWDGRSALRDSAAETARFLNALWHAHAQGPVEPISFSDYEHALVSNGRLLYRNNHRGCQSDDDCGSFYTCQSSQCHYDLAKNVKCGMPSGWTANVKVKGGSRDADHAFLSVPDDGSRADLYTHDDGSGHQKWRFEKLGDGSYNIVVGGGVSGGRKFLSATADGGKVDLTTTDDGSGRQRWLVERVAEDTTDSCIDGEASCSKSVHIAIKGGVSGGRRLLSVGGNNAVDLWTSDDASGRQRWLIR